MVTYVCVAFSKAGSSSGASTCSSLENPQRNLIFNYDSLIVKVIL